MPGFVSNQAEDDMTEQEIQALVDARIASISRRTFTRTYLFPANNTSGVVPALPSGGSRVSGGTMVCATPKLALNTGTPAGADRLLQVSEAFGGELWQDTSALVAIDTTTLANWWNSQHYVTATMGTSVSSITSATATMYAGVELATYQTNLPFPTPPTSVGGDQACHLRAKMNTGAWEVMQDDHNTQTVTALTGVPPFAGDLGTYKMELIYTPGISLVAKINGYTGATITGSNLILDTDSAMPHLGAGIFVTSGTSGSGRLGMTFSAFTATMVVPA